MPVKIKPSTKDYIRDARGKMTNKWVWKHYTVSNTSTEDEFTVTNMMTQLKRHTAGSSYVLCNPAKEM